MYFPLQYNAQLCSLPSSTKCWLLSGGYGFESWQIHSHLQQLGDQEGTISSAHCVGRMRSLLHQSTRRKLSNFGKNKAVLKKNTKIKTKLSSKCVQPSCGCQCKTVCKDAATSHILREILKKGTVKSGISGHNNYKKNSAKSCTYCYNSTNVHKKKKWRLYWIIQPSQYPTLLRWPHWINNTERQCSYLHWYYLFHSIYWLQTIYRISHTEIYH